MGKFDIELVSEEEYEAHKDDPILNDDDDDIPECCIACGGNYPDCSDSCKIFDD